MALDLASALQLNVSRKQKYSDLLARQAASTEPTPSWGAALARALQGGLAGLYEKGDRDTAGRKFDTIYPPEVLAAALASPNPTGTQPPSGGRADASGVQIGPYGSGPSPLDPPVGNERDTMVRLMHAEARNQPDEGKLAVANVIRNRAATGNEGGDTVSGVINKPWAFEPMMTPKGRETMKSLDASGPEYQKLSGMVDQAYTGAADPTGGAVNFYSPTEQAKLGRPPPPWSVGRPSQDIGGHRFFGGAGPQPVVQPSVDGSAPEPSAVGPTAAGVGAEGGGSSAGQVAQAGPVAKPAAPAPNLAPRIPPTVRSAARELWINGEEAAAAAILEPYIKPDAYNFTTTPAGDVLRTSPRGSVDTVYKTPLKPTYGVIRKDEFGREIYGWIDPDKRTITEPNPGQTVTAGNPAIPPAPPGVDPKQWREKRGERVIEESMPADNKQVSALRKEIQDIPSYKNIAQSAPVYRSMLDAAKRDNRAADVNMIYGMAKLMDPGSVVRESEMTIAQAIATLPQNIKAQISSQFLQTGRLDPDVRAGIMQESQSRVQAYQHMFDQDATMFKGIAERNRMDMRDVIPTFGPHEEFKAPNLPTLQEAEEVARKRKLIP